MSDSIVAVVLFIDFPFNQWEGQWADCPEDNHDQ